MLPHPTQSHDINLDLPITRIPSIGKREVYINAKPETICVIVVEKYLDDSKQ
jgi:hypothetical protein